MCFFCIVSRDYSDVFLFKNKKRHSFHISLLPRTVGHPFEMFQTCFWIPLLHNFFFCFPFYQLTTCVSSVEDVLCPQMLFVAMLTCTSEDLLHRESLPLTYRDSDAFKCVSGVYKLLRLTVKWVSDERLYLQAVDLRGVHHAFLFFSL